MSIKQKLLNAVSAHPKFVAFGIGLAIIMAVGTAIGMLDHNQMAFAHYGGKGGNANSNDQ